MEIIIIVAMTAQRVIGNNNTIPWHLSDDLKRFKKITMGYPILMGRKTFDSLARPLPGRHNIVMTRSSNFSIEGCTIVHNWNETIKIVHGAQKLFVIGGKAIYKLALPHVTKMYITLVETAVKGDVYFPDFDLSNWQKVETASIQANANNEYNAKFFELTRKH